MPRVASPRWASGVVVCCLLAGTGCSGSPPAPIVSAPTRAPGGVSSAGGSTAVVIPEGFLQGEALAKRPLTQPEVRWVREDGADFPPQLNPCGRSFPSDAERVAGRQMILTSARLWKSERLIVYRDLGAAVQAIAELRFAVRDCARHDNGNDMVTVWKARVLPIGDEAMFISGQRYLGADPIPGHYRAVVMRSGRTVVGYVDYNTGDQPPELADMDSYQRAAQTMAAHLSAAPWANASPQSGS
jgi:hypothetical protein